MSIKIRATRPEDFDETYTVIREAFWNVFKPGTDVHWSSNLVRGWDSYIAQLDFIAVDGERIVGNVINRKAAILGDDGINYVTVRLGPLAVLPKYQRQGIGRRLIEKTIETAREMKFRSIMLLGDPEYYLKRGFKPAEAFGTSGYMHLNCMKARSFRGDISINRNINSMPSNSRFSTANFPIKSCSRIRLRNFG